jgi:hypothetical protein
VPFTKYHWSGQINEGTYAGHVESTQKIRYAYKILIRKPLGTPCIQLGRHNGLSKQVGMWDFSSSAMLRKVDWQLATFRDSLSRLSSTVKQSAGPLKIRPVANHWSVLRNISEDRRPHLTSSEAWNLSKFLFFRYLQVDFPTTPIVLGQELFWTTRNTNRWA